MTHWYTLYTKPSAEYQVAASLQKRGIETYLPEIEIPKARQGRDKKPFFPCYVFVKVDFEQVGLSRVQWTPGLRRIVSFDGQPAPLADDVIDMIRSKLDGINTAGAWPAHDFQPGERVQITNGPLQGMQAIFEGSTTPAQRVRVLLKFLGHARSTWVNTSELEKAPCDADAPAHTRSRRTRGRGRGIKNNF